MISRKVCLLGAFAVGKTSLVRRFVHEVFDEKYTTTLGVKIDTKTVTTPATDVKLIIWDLEGADPADRDTGLINTRMAAYLQGVDAALLVADGTRPATLDVSRQMYDWLRAEHPDIPVALLLNKSDLTEDWKLPDGAGQDWPGLQQCLTTSALSGANVERTFRYLAEALSDGP